MGNSKQKLLNFSDNQHTIVSNAVGLLGVMASSSENTGISFDWNSLTPRYNGNAFSFFMGDYGQGAFSIYNTDIKNKDWLRHEGTHVFQSRAMGSLFYPTYLANSLNVLARFQGENIYEWNWWEEQAREHPF